MRSCLRTRVWQAYFLQLSLSDTVIVNLHCSESVYLGVKLLLPGYCAEWVAAYNYEIIGCRWGCESTWVKRVTYWRPPSISLGDNDGVLGNVPWTATIIQHRLKELSSFNSEEVMCHEVDINAVGRENMWIEFLESNATLSHRTPRTRKDSFIAAASSIRPRRTVSLKKRLLCDANLALIRESIWIRLHCGLAYFEVALSCC